MLLFSGYVTLQFVMSECKLVLVHILRVLHSRLVPPQILQARKTNGIWQQRTLRNKQFNIHNKTGIKINEKYNVIAAFVEIQLWPVKWK